MPTELHVQQSTTRPLYRKIVRDGVPGNYEIVREMIRLIRNGVDYDLGLQALAARVLTDNGIDSHSPAREQLTAIVNFVAANVTYIQDIAGRIESLKSARQTLLDRYGDCDDQTVVNCSLAGCLGFEDVRIAMAKYDKDAKSFAHVYCTVYAANGERFVLDTSLPSPQLNKEVQAAEVKEINVFDNVPGFDSFSGAWHEVRRNAREAARFTKNIVPAVLSVAPLGVLAGKALETGAELIDTSTGKELSLPAIGSKINRRLDKIINDLIRSRMPYDLAKSEALSIAAQLAAVPVKNETYAFTVIRASIKDKLDFINYFPEYAKTNNIKVVYLNTTAMLCVGIALAGGAAYVIYRNYKSKR